MEGRVLLMNGDMIAVRLSDSSYSVFRVMSPMSIEIGDSFLGSLASSGPQLLLHCRTQQWVDVKIRIARSRKAVRSRKCAQGSNPRLVN